MKLTLTIECGNSAFLDDLTGEASRILHDIAEDIRLKKILGGYQRDSDGNIVGQWQFEPSDAQ